jgi:hypothetical protein
MIKCHAGKQKVESGKQKAEILHPDSGIQGIARVPSLFYDRDLFLFLVIIISSWYKRPLLISGHTYEHKRHRADCLGF